MRETGSIEVVRAAVRAARTHGARIGFVPTMGALHEGHARLATRARREADFVVMSVFVNPLQFGPGEDFARYPRDPGGDAATARASGVDLLFAPAPEELYPRPMRVGVQPLQLADRWEGPLRPGHFAGVLTVVLKLFNVVQPDVAVFGQKDFQQAALVGAMVEDLALPVRLVVEPTVREASGLALSSRNRYLSDAERASAVRVPRALTAAGAAFAAGAREAAAIEEAARTELGGDPPLHVDYLALADGRTLEPKALAEAGDVVLLAVRLGSTRLLDNLVLGHP